MTMITPSYLGETIEYSSLHACRSTLEDPTEPPRIILDDPASDSVIKRQVRFTWSGGDKRYPLVIHSVTCSDPAFSLERTYQLPEGRQSIQASDLNRAFAVDETFVFSCRVPKDRSSKSGICTITYRQAGIEGSIDLPVELRIRPTLYCAPKSAVFSAASDSLLIGQKKRVILISKTNGFPRVIAAPEFLTYSIRSSEKSGPGQNTIGRSTFALDLEVSKVPDLASSISVIVVQNEEGPEKQLRIPVEIMLLGQQ